jgi:hypothetical protein
MSPLRTPRLFQIEKQVSDRIAGSVRLPVQIQREDREALPARSPSVVISPTARLGGIQVNAMIVLSDAPVSRPSDNGKSLARRSAAQNPGRFAIQRLTYPAINFVRVGDAEFRPPHFTFCRRSLVGKKRKQVTAVYSSPEMLVVLERHFRRTRFPE